MDETGKKKKKEFRVRQLPSVPFLWEVKPGFPKKDWKPEDSSSSFSSSVPQIPKTPLKLIASVPFAWEEKPGKPIPDFSYKSLESIAQQNIGAKASSSSSSGFWVACKYGCDDDNDNDNKSSSDSESLEALSFETDESFSSSQPSLLANCLVSSSQISTAIPLQKNSYCVENCDKLEASSSPASDTGSSSTSSYETGRSSLVGASFLERLFPLIPPNSGFFEKASGYSENISSSPQELNGTDFDGENNMVRRPPTLGELIMMSRRRSHRRKAIQMRKWDLPRNITTNEAFGCCMFANSGNMIEGLLKRKYFPRLKLM